MTVIPNEPGRFLPSVEMTVVYEPIPNYANIQAGYWIQETNLESLIFPVILSTPESLG
jgi:hypothetical protein